VPETEFIRTRGHIIESNRGKWLCGKIKSMGITDIFSKRKTRASGIKTDIFDYDSIPEELRVQIVYMIRDVIGPPNSSDGHQGYKVIHDRLAREYGVHQLVPAPNHHRLEGDQLFDFIQSTDLVARVLDAIEVSLTVGRERQSRMAHRPNMYVHEAIAELNQRFMEAGVGYQYESEQMIRVDSQFAHAEIVKPALVLLSDPRYHGAEEEFLKAHKNYRDGDYKGCLTECLKSFESTMKIICDIRNWTYQKTDTAKTLIGVCFTNKLIPSMLQAKLNALQTVLESGVPTLRNKLGGHGQGSVSTTVPPHVAAYALHLTAANIVLLVTAERNP
jgi:hypothetical protein